jgi:hypothetical protein
MRRLAIIGVAVAFWAAGCGEDTPTAPDDGKPGPNPNSVWKIAYEVDIETADYFSDLWFTGPRDGWACGDDKLFHYDGDEWSVWRVFEGGQSRWLLTLNAVCVLGPNDIWVGGSNYRHSEKPRLFHFNGSSWEYYYLEGLEEVKDIFFVAPDKGWACGDDGIFYYDGTGWTRQRDGYFCSLSMLRPDYGWAGGDDLLAWDGSEWRSLGFSSPAVKISQILLNSPTEGWVIGGRGGDTGILYHYDGSSWTPIQWRYGSFDSGAFASRGYGWLATDTTSIFYDHGELKPYAWPFPYLTVTSFWINAEDDVWAAGSYYRTHIFHFSGFRD